MRSRSIRSSSLLILLAAGQAYAQQPPPPPPGVPQDNTRMAREHYKKGEEAFAASRYEEAFKEFEAGYTLVPRPVFLLNMAHSERRRGDLRNARALYKKFLVVDPQSKYRGEVEQVLTELEGAIAAEQSAGSGKAPSLAPSPPVVTPDVTVQAPPPREKPVYERWWFWGAVGGVVAAGVLTAVLLSSGGSSYTKNGSLGTFKP